MTSCGRKETCGGHFSSGPGDSDWTPCATHQVDHEHIGEVYTAQVSALASGEEMPATVEECQVFLKRRTAKEELE